MVRITEELVRKKAEHNENEIGSLEEISLHQENIEAIENIQHWCRNLEILLLQSNLISRIENLHKLKKLQYLNLAINNIECIENLEGCESLNKLDLTLNFIGNLSSVSSLKNNIHLKHFYLTGNPCTDYQGYRSYVITVLPQLEDLDNEVILHSERIKALQEHENVTREILIKQEEYKIIRENQKERLKEWIRVNEKCNWDDEEENRKFWESKCEHAPETRIFLAKAKDKNKKNENKNIKPEIKIPRLFAKDGRPLNINQSKIPFKFSDQINVFVLDISIYKFLDTSLINVDIQPSYVRIFIKGKIFQYALPEEIHVYKCVTKRSQTTGHLVITMPVLKTRTALTPECTNKNQNADNVSLKKTQYFQDSNFITKRESLAIGSSIQQVDLTNIMNTKGKSFEKCTVFMDNPDVPPLE